MIIREVENPRLKDLLGWNRYPIKESWISKEDFLHGIQIIGSGKGAITLVLKYLANKNIITDRNDEMIVSDWIGTWVYNEMLPWIFPVKKFSEKAKVIFVYHQYGFPQDMDKILEFAREKNLIVIEDCAHSLASYYKGKPLGSMGDFAIYSFSKWFFCFALGGVKSKYNDFSAYADMSIENVPFGLTAGKDLTKLLYEWSTFSNSQLFKRYAHLFLQMSYSFYEEAFKPSRLAKKLFTNKIDREVDIRQRRYQYFLSQTSSLGICDHLEKDGVTPYIIPIYCSEDKNGKIIRALAKMGVETGLYHFDINRNLLSPKFVRCIRIPCHGGISDSKFNTIVELIVESFRGRN